MVTPREIDPHQVAVYIRWSTDDQSEGTTLETQLERCKHYVASQGWCFQDELVYIDDGYSGGTLDRPAMARLRRDVEERKVECVVAYKIDRLSRSVVDIVDLVLREWEGRCYVKSTTEDVNTLTPAGKMFFYILISFAEYERNVIKERTMGGKIKRAEQGLNPGFRPPYGYVKGRDTGTFEVVEHEASVVRRMFEMYHKGNGANSIAHTLNAEGITRRGHLWTELTIRRLLAHTAYIGVLQYGKRMRTTKEQRERQGLKSEVVYDKPRFAAVEGAFPEIVDRKVWEDVQALLSARSTKGKITKPTYSDYLLSGLAVCRCGAPVNGKLVKEHLYYYCSARKRHGPSVCDAGYVPAREVDEQIEIRAKALLSTEGRKTFLLHLEEDIDQRVREVRSELDRERLRLDLLAQRGRRVEQDYRSGELPAKLYARESEALETDQHKSREAIRSLEIHLHGLDLSKGNKEALLSTIDTINAWEDMNIPERRQLLQKLTKTIVLYRKSNSGEQTTLKIDWVKLE